MAPKKGGAKKRDTAGKPAVDVRLETLRLFETTAESLLAQEAQRRDREEQEERLMVLREEHEEKVESLERALQNMQGKLALSEAALQSQQHDHTKLLAVARVECDGLVAQLQAVTAERDDVKAVVARYRQERVADTTKFRAQIDDLHAQYERERATLRQQVAAASALVEQHHRTLVSSSESQLTSERQNQICVDALKKELEAALALNKALQKSLDKAEETDRTNITLQQFLSAQLEETKRNYEGEIEEGRRQLAAAREQADQLTAKCRELEEQVTKASSEKAEAVEGTSAELRECQQLLEQVKFDTAYLNEEIGSMRREYSTRVAEAEAQRHEAQVIARQSAVEAEAMRMKMSEMEALLYRREREHFDEVTHLQAQVVDTKTTLSKAQGNCTGTDAMNATVDDKARQEELRRVYEVREKRLMEDICSLRTAILDMQHHLAAKEVELLVGQRASDAEINKLRNQLDSLKPIASIPT